MQFPSESGFMRSEVEFLDAWTMSQICRTSKEGILAIKFTTQVQVANLCENDKIHIIYIKVNEKVEFD